MVEIGEGMLNILKVDGVPAVVFHKFPRFLDELPGFQFDEDLEHCADFFF